MENNSNPKTKKPIEGKNNKPRTAAESLIDDVLASDAVLFLDQFGEAYIAQNGDGREVVELTSSEFSYWLFKSYWLREHRPLPKDADTQVVKTLSALAYYSGTTYDLYVRSVLKNDVLWYDLVNGNSVKVTPLGWEVVTDPIILFRRKQQKPQVTPAIDGELGLLRSYVNVASDDDWLLFMVFTITAFIPGFPHPLLVLHGPQGAGKTTPMRVIKKLVDPSAVQGMSLPTDTKEFVQLASHHTFLFFDNLSGLSRKMSDSLARAITGDTFSKRKLYTNNDNVVYSIQNPMAINGINQVISKPDLLDRSILIELKRIEQEARIPEDQFWEAFEHDKPQLLGAIFDVLAKAMAIYPTLELEELPRMADFTRWACAVSEAAGYTQQDFLNAYKANIALQNEEAIDASPIAKAVISLIDDCEDGIWQGSPTELLGALNRRLDTINSSSNPLWPKGPEMVTRSLKNAQVNLKEIGIQVDTFRSSRGRFIVIEKTSTDDENDTMSADLKV